MKTNKNTKEFELSFNFRSVLYIAQVTTWSQLNDNYFAIDYFSPNEKGKIYLLSTSDNKGTQWQEPANTHDKEFIKEIINQLQNKI